MADLSSTITKLEVTHNPVPWGQGFSLSAHISTAGPNRVHGDVEFFADGASLGIARTDSTGVAAIGVPGGLVHPGAHEFGAAFRGDAYNEPSEAEVMVINMSPAIGDPWPVEDQVEKFKGANPPEPEPMVRPVPVREEPLPPEPVVQEQPLPVLHPEPEPVS
jgi:hypothetical protein